jgi:hypothetical protein
LIYPGPWLRIHVWVCRPLLESLDLTVISVKCLFRNEKFSSDFRCKVAGFR